MSTSAVALGLGAIRKAGWLEGIPQNCTVRVLVRDTPVEHAVPLTVFNQWLERRGRSPKEVTI